MYPCYLDIDGCIDNPLAWSKIGIDGPVTLDEHLSLLSAEKIALLNQLDSVQIVISSSWRITSHFDVATLLKLKGLKLPVIGSTPRLQSIAGGWANFGSGWEKGLRAREIAQHAKANRFRFDRLVVIDDDPTATTPGPGFPKIGSCFIKTKSFSGLQQKHICRIEQKINQWSKHANQRTQA